MSGEFPVNADGRVVLPRLGEIAISGVPADSLQSFLTDKYRVYLNNPSIEVVLLRRVTITGAVRNPGVYPLMTTMTVADALALAGGPAEDGKRDKVEIRRDDRVVDADLRANRTIADSPIQSGDELYVPSKTWLGRNPWVLSGVLSALTAVIVTRVSR